MSTNVNPFLLKKWEKVFNTFFDVNESREMDWGDFYIVTRHVRNIYGNDSEQIEMAKNTLKALWDGLLTIADRNKDQKIQLSEWVALLKQSDPQNVQQWFLDYMTFMFRLMDVSADGKLDVAEYTDGMATYGFNEAAAHEAFKKFAVDSNNKPIPSLDFSQYRKLWLDYFYSADPNAPGNHLFGVLQ